MSAQPPRCPHCDGEMGVGPGAFMGRCSRDCLYCFGSRCTHVRRLVESLAARAERAERSLAEAVKLLRECVGVDGSEDGDDAGLYDLALAAMNPLTGIDHATGVDADAELFSGIAQARIDTVRTFLARHGGTP